MGNDNERMKMFADGQDKLEYTEGEMVFRTDIKGEPKWRSVPYFVAGGLLLGLLLWAYFDRNVSWLHISWWGIGLALIIGLLGLPIFRKKELKEIRIDAEGFKIIWAVGSVEHKWKELEAARFETYPVINLHTNVHCFRYRINGKNTEIIIDGLGDKGIRVFNIVMERFLCDYKIPPECKELRSLNYLLAMGGAFTFLTGALGIIIAYILFYRTLGVIFGGSVMAAGAVMAFMSRRERISRYMLAASIVIVASLIITGWALNINVGQVLRDWEKQERQLRRLPWTRTIQADSNEHVSAGKEKKY